MKLLIPIMIPRAIPTIADKEKPIATRPRLANICNPNPLSVPPSSKKGWVIRGFQVSLITVIGPGKRESGLPQITCQTSSKTAIATSGGMIFLVRAAAMSLFELLLLGRLSSVVAILRGFFAEGARHRKRQGKRSYNRDP